MSTPNKNEFRSLYKGESLFKTRNPVANCIIKSLVKTQDWQQSLRMTRSIWGVIAISPNVLIQVVTILSDLYPDLVELVPVEVYADLDLH